MKRAISILSILFALSISAAAQQIVTSITVTGIGTETCTPGQQCRARGFNFLLGYPAGFGWANGATVTVYSVMPDGSLKQSPRAIPNTDRVDFYPAIGSEGAVAYRFISRFYDVQTGPLAPVPTFAPVLFARGRFCYTRPAPGACEDFNGVLAFPSSVGIVALTIEAAGTGAFSSDWSLVITDGPNDEQSSFGLEFPATSFPAGQGNATDKISATIGRLPAGNYFWRVYKPVAGGTIVQSVAVAFQVP